MDKERERIHDWDSARKRVLRQTGGFQEKRNVKSDNYMNLKIVCVGGGWLRRVDRDKSEC